MLTEVLAAFPVYRAYVHPGEPPSAVAEAAIREAVDGARRQLPRRLRGLAADLGAAVLGAHGPVSGAAGRAGEFAVRFQQTTGPVLAKGVEDTASYRWSAAVALNEVGCDPDRFGVAPGGVPRGGRAAGGRLAGHDDHAVHARHQAARRTSGPGWRCWPRCRRSGAGRSGSGTSGRWRRGHGRAAAAVDPDTEYLLWQTLVGAWPISGERLAGYLTKAMREAKRRTSWTRPTRSTRRRCSAWPPGRSTTPSCPGRSRASSPGSRATPRSTRSARSWSSSPCRASPTSTRDASWPRCPWSTRITGGRSDFARRRSELTGLDASPDASRGDALADGDLTPDRAKLLVTSRALRLRRARPEWFAGGYEPLAASGPAAAHVVAFRRGGRAVTVVTRLPVGCAARRLAGHGAAAARRRLGDLLTGAVHRGGAVPLAELTGRLPVALLVPEGRVT